MRTAKHKVYCAVKGTSGSVDPTDEALPIMSERLGIAGDEKKRDAAWRGWNRSSWGACSVKPTPGELLALTRRTTVDLLITK